MSVNFDATNLTQEQQDVFAFAWHTPGETLPEPLSNTFNDMLKSKWIIIDDNGLPEINPEIKSEVRKQPWFHG
jgi:hypothetical protein